jgi:hypothetical protein
MSFRLVKARAHALYTDSKLNNRKAVYLNVYQNYVIVALKVCWIRTACSKR